MTNKDAKVYLQYIKVLLQIHKCGDDKLNEALDLADVALDPEPVVCDPRFTM